ncbi:MAG: phosphoserine transaminase, partial [Patescibacteria group bacterium]
MTKPVRKPKNPNYSSGPCAKHPGYSLAALGNAPLGRSHRSSLGRSKLNESIVRTKKLLGLPEDYLVGIVPGSDTGAMEMAMWNLLGARGVEVVYFESFGKAWAADVKDQLKLADAVYHKADYGQLPDLSRVDCDRDVVLTWNGTTSGVKIPNGDWIPAERKGLTICDATSAVFAMEMPWDKLDATTFSWQKVLGGEAAHGMLILSPRAVERIESHTPAWPVPKLFQLRKKGALDREIFTGSTINTPSMLCNEDYLDALAWAESIGGLPALIARTEANLRVVEAFVAAHDWIRFLAAEERIRSNTSVCLSIDLDEDRLQRLVKLLAQEGVAYDCASYREAPPGLRFWCGATIEEEDLRIVMDWLAWA